MEKNTILAVALSSIVLIVFFVIQGLFAPPPPPVVAEQQQPLVTPVAPDAAFDFDLARQEQEILLQQQLQAAQAIAGVDIAEPPVVDPVIVETESIRVTFSQAGANITSWQLLNHHECQRYRRPVEMIFAGYNEAQAFSIAFGGLNTQPETSLFFVNRVSPLTVEFYRYFAVPGRLPADPVETFRLTKRYEFAEREYMFRLTITLAGGHLGQVFNFGGSAYTLSFGPQIGPEFDRLDGREDFRNLVTFVDGRRTRGRSAPRPNEFIGTPLPEWSAIEGKYFVFIAIPRNVGAHSIVFTETPEPGIPAASRFNLVRAAVDSPRVSDEFLFYLGPRSPQALAIYHSGRNEFGLIGHSIEQIASSRGILAPLENLLKWMLNWLVRISPGNNFGIAIILLTLIVKIAFFPLTKKGSEATLRMQALAPKIKELQEKHKGNPQKLQAEMGKFYKQEGYNPLAGCLPMLLQLPIFIAMFNLFNNHFELRGAMFIPGWIPDLSVPESIVQLPFSLPFLGDMVRGLPFIYVASQLMYGKVTQAPGQQTPGQMKMMLYVMPIVFFFILYNMPSGLLVYWIFSNVLTLVQQMMIIKYQKAKKEREQTEVPATIIAPPPKKKKNR